MLACRECLYVCMHMYGDNHTVYMYVCICMGIIIQYILCMYDM